MQRKKMNMVGRRFGRLVVTAEAPTRRHASGSTFPQWHVRCDCGGTRVADGSGLRAGKTHSCGCENKPADLTGQTLGKWTVLERVPGSKGGSPLWRARCRCGAEFIRCTNALRNTESCALCANKPERTAPEPPPVPDARWIALSSGKFALVDQADFDVLSKDTWCYSKGYAVQASGARERMHRLILGAPAHLEVDHANLDTLDNRRANLRPATKAQNQFNIRSRGGRSRFKGVSPVRGPKPWRATIVVAGRQTHLGRFATEEAAANAYDEAAIRLHGEFARPNFPRKEAACTTRAR